MPANATCGVYFSSGVFYCIGYVQVRSLKNLDRAINCFPNLHLLMIFCLFDRLRVVTLKAHCVFLFSILLVFLEYPAYFWPKNVANFDT